MTNQVQQRGLKKIQSGINFAMINEAFIASVLLKLKVKETPDGTFATDGTFLYWCAAFIETALNVFQVGFVLLHEVFHVILGHCTSRGFRDLDTWNVACDHAVNILIIRLGLIPQFTDAQFRQLSRDFVMSLQADQYRAPEYMMPPDGVMDPKFAGMSAHAIYAELAKEGQGQGDQGQDQGQDDSQGDQGQDQGQDPSDGEPGQARGGCPWGAVEDMADEDGNALEGEALEDAVQDLADIISVAETVARGRGQMPGILTDAITVSREHDKDWAEELPEIIRQDTPRDMSYARQNRMHMNSPIVMPSIEMEGMGPVLIMADASGSVSKREFSMFIGQAIALMEQLSPEHIGLVQFDSKARPIEIIEQGDEPDPIRRAGGGTDYRAPFDYAEEEGILDDYEAIIIFTDGGDNNPWPEDPGVPVIWATTAPFYQGEPPFGTVLDVKF